MPKILRLCLYALSFFAVFNFTSSLMGGGYIVSDLGGSPEIAMYGVSFFGIGNACTFPLAFELGRRFGKLQVLLCSLIWFVITTYLCAKAPTFFVFVLFRFFAGVASGAFFPLSLSLLQEHTTVEQKNRMLAFLALIMTVTPVLAACYGGAVAYVLHWSWVFYSQLPFLIVLACILYRHKTPQIPSHMPFDWTGYVFYTLGFGGLITAISLGQELDWFRSPFICFLLALTFFSLLFFVLWELSHEKPFIPIHLLKIPTFALSIFCIFSLFSAYFGMILLLALWLQIDAKYSPLWIVLILSHMAVAGGILFGALERWFEHTTSLWVVLVAIGFFAISCFYSQTFNAEVNFGRLTTARIFAGFGLAFFLFPLLIVCLRSLPPADALPGLAFFQSVRLIAGSLGSVSYTTIWIRRKVFYHERLGEQLTVYSEQTREFMSELSVYSPSPLGTKKLLGESLDVQADALALADCFYLMGWLMVFVFFVTLVHLLKHRKDKALPKST